jgi:hypothetical protein
MKSNPQKTPRKSRLKLISGLSLSAALCFTQFGCISNLLKEKIPAFSEEISFKEPASPFEKIKSASYPSWKNHDTQNVILIISNCDNTRYPVGHAYQTISESLEDVKVDGLKLAGLKIPRVDSKKVVGVLDSSPVEIRTVAFDFKNCVFLSGLSGKPQSIEKDFENWKSFLNSIELKK